MVPSWSTCKIKRLIDLLPDRSATSLESWLKSHPGVQLISRDRSGDYATGASKGAPDAVQVADRFHVQKNLSEAVERIFHRHREALQQIRVAGSRSSSALVASPIPRPERQAQREQTRSKRMQRYEAVRELYLQGTSLSEIARRFQMGRMTVQKFAYADVYPDTAAYRVKAGMLHPYEVYLRERWQQGCRNGAKLYREVVAMGYPGKRKQVARLIAHLRKQTQAGVTDFSAQPQGLTPRAAVSLLMRRPEKVTQEQQQALIRMRQVHPEIEQVMEIVKSFLQMLRTLQGQQLEVWMERVQQSNIREMQNFVEKLRKDQDAVQAGLTLVWSNGVVEGHVNRLKCLKRTMYGRAKFDLLRQRVLYRSLPSPSGSFHEMCGRAEILGPSYNYVMGVWAGNNNNLPMINVIGVTGAGPIWHEGMLLAEQERAPSNFPTPPGLVQRTVTYPEGTTTTDWYIKGVPWTDWGLGWPGSL